MVIGWSLACHRGRASYKPKRNLPVANDGLQEVQRVSSQRPFANFGYAAKTVLDHDMFKTEVGQVPTFVNDR